MILLAALRSIARDTLADWRSLDLSTLQFAHRSEAQLLLIVLAGLSAVLLVTRLTIGRRAGRHQLVLPAVLASLPPSRASLLMHAPLLLAFFGILFLALAVADPYTPLMRREMAYPGRRISLAIDASSSMVTPFTSKSLNTRAETDAAFFTTVAAAQRFVQMRVNGRYRDLVSLVEFGHEAYVITPFTNDYENILLSISLIGDPGEFEHFPEQGTIIAQAISESVELFKAFNFLDAAGNLLVIFSDGEDTNATAHGRPLDDILKGAVEAKVPVYFVRMNYGFGKDEAKQIPDYMWIEAVEKTGGEFFAASDEKSLFHAIEEIDRVSAGTIQVKEFNSQRPQFPLFALAAAACFAGALGLKLASPYFLKFP